MKKVRIRLSENKRGSVELKKGTSDSEIKKYTEKGIDVQLVDPNTEQLEEEIQKYTTEESGAVGYEVAKSLVKVLRAQGNELASLKLTGVGVNKFNIHVQYGQEKGEDTFRFILSPELKSIALDSAQGPIELSDFIITQGNEVSIPTPQLEDKLADAMVKYVSSPSDEEYDDMAANELPTDPSQINKNIAEVNSEADLELIRKFIKMVETEPTKFERLYKQAKVQAGTTSDIKLKHVLSLMDKANAYYHQSMANQERFDADREGMYEKLDPVGKEDDDINNDGKVNSTDKYLGKRRDAVAKNIGEDLDVGHQDDEPAMLKSDVYRIAKMAAMLYKELDKFDGTQEVDFPHWWQAKIIKAYDYLQSAYGFLDGQNKVAQLDTTGVLALDEEKGTCCHKCGHTHVKGTAHPTPYNTGKSNCKYRD